MFALQVDYKRVSDRHTSAYVAPRHSHDGKFSVSLCAGHGLGVATRMRSMLWLKIRSLAGPTRETRSLHTRGHGHKHTHCVTRITPP